MRIKTSTRLVILVGKYALKFPLSRRGFLQCKNERRIWQDYKHTNLIGTLHWESLGIVCMKRYESVKNIPISQIEIVKSTILEFDIPRCDLHNPHNWGIEDGKYYLIDYGINQYISTLYC
jgi:hypothetical protein